MKNRIAVWMLLAGCIILQSTPVLAQGTSGSIPLVASEVTASSITNTSAVISWRTNGNATSQVFYDTASHNAAAEYAQSTVQDSSLITSHRVTLTSLAAGTNYHYRIRSTIPADGIEVMSDDLIFTTQTATGGGGGAASPGPKTTPDVTPDNFASLPPDEAALIIEKMTPAAAAVLFEVIDTAKVADILEKLTPEKSIAVMEGLSADKLTGIMLDMSEALLLERLPGLSPEKLYSISPQALFTALPNVPAEQLVAETPPEPPSGAVPPVTLYTGPDNARYLTVRTFAGEWVVIVATPPPFGIVLIKTKNAAENVRTTVETFTSRPPEIAAALPAKALIGTYFKITIENITADNIQLGYINFKVDRLWLESYPINEWGVFLNRYDSGFTDWMQLPTRKVNEDAGYIYYAAVTSHFSTFAITGYQINPAPKVKASGLSVLPAAPKAGEPVTVSADLTNLSNTNVTYPATLWINGRIEVGQDISLKASETKKVSFPTSRSADGNYNVRLERLLGRFTIGQAAATPLPSPSPSPSPSTSPTQPSPLPSVKPSPSIQPGTPTPAGTAPAPETRWPVIIGIIAGFVALLSGGWLFMTSRAAKNRTKLGGAAERDETGEVVDAEARAYVDELVDKLAREDEEALKAEEAGAAKEKSEALTKAQWEAQMARLAREAEAARQETERVKQENARLEAEKEQGNREAAARLVARKAKEDAETAQKEAETAPREKARRAAEEARKAQALDEKAKKVLRDSAKLAEANAKETQRLNALRIKEELEAEAKARRETEAIDRERERRRAELSRKARGVSTLYDRMRAVLNTEITFKPQKLPKPPKRPAMRPAPPDNSIMLVLINAKTAEDITRFQRRLERIEGVRIMLTGGSMVDGILFGITLTTPVDLIESIRQITMVEEVVVQGETIFVTLKRLDRL